MRLKNVNWMSYMNDEWRHCQGPDRWWVGLCTVCWCTVTLCEEVWILKRLYLLKSNTNPDGFIGIMLFEYQILYSQNWIYFNIYWIYISILYRTLFISDFRVSSVVTSYLRTAACSLSCTKRNNSYNRNPILIAYSVYIHCSYYRNYLLLQKPLKWWVI